MNAENAENAENAGASGARTMAWKSSRLPEPHRAVFPGVLEITVPRSEEFQKLTLLSPRDEFFERARDHGLFGTVAAQPESAFRAHPVRSPHYIAWIV